MKTKDDWKGGRLKERIEIDGPTQRKEEGKGRERGRDRPSVPLLGFPGFTGDWQESEGGPGTGTDAQSNQRWKREKGDQRRERRERK